MTLNIPTLTAHRVMSMRMRWTRGTDPWASLHITCPLSRKNVKRGLLMPWATQDLRVTSPSPGLVPEEIVPPYSGLDDHRGDTRPPQGEERILLLMVAHRYNVA